MRNYSKKIKTEARKLRSQGKTLSEIRDYITKKRGILIPKSTLSGWLKGIKLTEPQLARINKLVYQNIKKAREASILSKKNKKEAKLNEIRQKNTYLGELLKNKNTAKITLATLYLGEGGKKTKGSLVLGNSDPSIIRLFMKLLRECYKIDEGKFRCTLQCRADQNIKELEKFWSKVTKIPMTQFYKAQVDPRTVGKISRKKKYKGVCRVDYFSSEIYDELMMAGEIISEF